MMKTPSSAETLIPREETGRTPVTGLSPELLAQSARRLRILALLYAFVFFMSDPLQAVLLSDQRARFLASAIRWAPSTISIAAALLVAALTWNRLIRVETVLTLGLVFPGLQCGWPVSLSLFLPHPARHSRQRWHPQPRFR